MYWPLGAPRSFAQQLPLELSQITNDALDKASAPPADEGAQDHERTPTGKQDDRKDETHSSPDDARILCMRMTRHGNTFATITSCSLTVWQTHPPVILTSIIRSAQSLSKYGPNTSLLLRPDGEILVLQTQLGYLISYSLSLHPEHRPYDLLLRNSERRRQSLDARSYATKRHDPLFDGGGLCPDASLRFRMVIKVDAGITKALALDAELVIVTRRPAAVQCIPWPSDQDTAQPVTELVEKMGWLEGKEGLIDVVYDRPMNLFTFSTASGQVYAVQKIAGGRKSEQKPLFRGHLFHQPINPDEAAVKTAINSRFSVIAVGAADGTISLYTVRDYAGGITHLCKLQPSVSRNSTGALTVLTYSPDGYCLFAGYENGWATWSVYGQAGGTSFSANAEYTKLSNDTWLDGVLDASWTASGADLIMLDTKGDRLWMLEFARSAIAGCFTPANIARTMLQTNSGFMVYKGHSTPDLLTIAADISLWQHIKAPAVYLADQGPIRTAVMSADGRYLAIAGQRGLAHYSIQSGRWRTFEDITEQNSFAVRGGMCWHHHILIVATEAADGHEIRLYSRETALSQSKVLHVEQLTAPAVHLAPSGEDSILVYTNDNILDHYIIAASNSTVGLVRVGQIALHGIIRAPPRVRSVSWVVPDHQLQTGEPSQDVATASVFFLVDGKLVLLQPSATDNGELKYDMRVIAQHVEYYMLARDTPESSTDNTNSEDENENEDIKPDHNLSNSLWLFDGHAVKLWPDVRQLLASSAQDSFQELQAPVSIPLDFYPLSVLLAKGILFGVEAELLQRRDSSFALFRVVARAALFLPPLLQHYLATSNEEAASDLADHYAHLPYFSHALEILLHNVLDETVDAADASSPSPTLPTTSSSSAPPSPSSPSSVIHTQPAVTLLQTVLTFLSHFPTYHTIILLCARKTELRSWRTLFQHLPSPLELFEASLAANDLKTAGGYLLVLHSLEEESEGGAKGGIANKEVVRLLRRAMQEGEWELCKELGRFLMALDESGGTLREAMRLVEGTPMLNSPSSRSPASSSNDGAQDSRRFGVDGAGGLGLSRAGLSPLTPDVQQDYFGAAAIGR